MTIGRAVLLLCLAVTALGFVLLGVPSTASSEEESPVEYKGSKACKACHKDQHQAWEGMKHSRAFEILRPEQIASGKDDKGRACVQCHTTGFGKGGFVSLEETPKLTNVGCESCHGPAGRHVETMIKAMMTEETVEEKHISKSVGCVQCHNPHISYKKLYGKR